MDKEKIKQESNSKTFITILVLLILMIMIIGFSVATITFTNESERINTISTGNISLDYKESKNGINITNAFPMTDEVGKKLTDKNQYFDFSIVSTISGDATITYEVSAEKEDSSTLSDKDVKLYLERKDNGVYREVMKPKNFTPITSKSKIGTPMGSMILINDTIKKTRTDNYRLRMWVADTTLIDGISRNFSVKVSVNAKVEANKK